MKNYTLIDAFNIGIKKNKKDAVCMMLSEKANIAMVTTKNKFAAAPVLLSKKYIKEIRTKYLLINSGNANACTGPIGLNNVKKYGKLISKKFKCKTNEVLIFSTGIVGEQLPIKKMLDSIVKKEFKFKSSWSDAASAIMTTDKFKKIITKSFFIKNQKIIVNAICKGAGMIEPDMATTLSFMEINIKATQKLLSTLLNNITKNSFNKISVDGDMSTNDSFVLIASGQNDKINFSLDKSSYMKLEQNLIKIAQNLSRKIVEDGEGSTKVIDINVINAKNNMEAKKVTLALANSTLIKTALNGSNPNWGRILAKLGSVHYASYSINKITLKLNDYIVFKNGSPLKKLDNSALKRSMKNKNIKIFLNLFSGKGFYNLVTSDLSKKYVHLNSMNST